jgi:hypothetical protein
MLLVRGGARSGVSFPVPTVVLRRTDEADTYKVVGYVRLRVRVSTGWRGRFRRRSSNGETAGQDPLGLQDKETTQSPGSRKIGILGKSVRSRFAEAEEAAALTPFMSALYPGTRLRSPHSSARQLANAGIGSPPFILSLHARCQHVPCLSPQHSQASTTPRAKDLPERRPANDAPRRQAFHPLPLWQRAASVWP